MAVELKAPMPGYFRVVGVDTFEGPTADYLIGDYGTLKKAQVMARQSRGKMTPVYVYDSDGNLVFTVEAL
jgi:hypothetical protein